MSHVESGLGEICVCHTLRAAQNHLPRELALRRVKRATVSHQPATQDAKFLKMKLRSLLRSSKKNVGEFGQREPHMPVLWFSCFL